MSGQTIKLGDFGLAFLVTRSSLVRPTDNGGTFSYMSPEKVDDILNGSERDFSFDEIAKADVW